MGSRYEVEVTIISANDLKNVNWRHGRLKPYAVAWVEHRNKSATRVDEEGDIHPSWDQKLVIPFNSAVAESYLYMDIVHAGKAAEGTKPLVGSTRLPLRNVDLGNCKGAVKKLELVRMSGRPHGNVEVKVVVRETRYHHAPDPYYAQPHGVPPQSYADYSAVEPRKVGRNTAPPAAPYRADPRARCPYYGQPARVSYGQPAYGGYRQDGQQQHGGYRQDGQQQQGANREGVMFVEVTVGDDGSYGDDSYDDGGYADGGGYDDGY